jgi:hypothetical protein
MVCGLDGIVIVEERIGVRNNDARTIKRTITLPVYTNLLCLVFM